jgi:membrane-associated phospholipid phosphatase
VFISIKRVLPFLSMSSIPIVNIGYTFLNNSNRGVHSLITDLDRALPFIKGFIIPYVGWYLFIFLTLIYFRIKDGKAYKTTLIATNLGILVSYTIYFFYQTTMPRPELIGTDWLTETVRLVYRNDQPYNCFPSIHSLTSFLMLRGIQSSTIRSRFNVSLIGGIAITIMISTLLVKQHTVLDVVGAIILGNLVYFLAKKLEEVNLTWQRKPSLLSTMRKKLVT